MSTTAGTTPASPAHLLARRSGATATAVTAASSPSATTRCGGSINQIAGTTTRAPRPAATRSTA